MEKSEEAQKVFQSRIRVCRSPPPPPQVQGTRARPGRAGAWRGRGVRRAGAVNQRLWHYLVSFLALKVRTDVTREDKMDFTHQEGLFWPSLVGSALKC